MGRYIYLHDELFPFLNKCGIDRVRGYMSQPSEHQLKRVQAFVADMVGATAPWENPADAPETSSSNLLLNIHTLQANPS
eukprot:6583267-Pyramimonas_sp.AAC.1